MLRIFLESIAVAAGLLICLSARTLGERLKVMDHPNGDHKHHVHATPSVGGIAILIPLLLWLAGSLAGGLLPDRELMLALFLCAAGVGVMGFADDQVPASPLVRVLFLLVFLGVGFAVAPQLIASQLNWGSFQTMPVAPIVYIALMALGTVGIVNAINMADGQNGLVSGMFVIWSACLTLVGDSTVSAIAGLLFVASAMAFVFNLRGRLFLGNCGSHGVTFVLGLLIMRTHAEGRISVEMAAVWFFIPVLDCLRLIAARWARGHSPASADTDHFHHRLQHKLGRHYGLFAYLTTVAATSFVATLMPRFTLVAIIVLTAIYFSLASLTESGVARKAKSEEPVRLAAGGQGKVVLLDHGERDRKRDET